MFNLSKPLRPVLTVLAFVFALQVFLGATGSPVRAQSKETQQEIALWDDLLSTVQPGQETVDMDDMTFDVAAVRQYRDSLTQTMTPSSAFSGSTWPNGQVPYAFSSNVSSLQRQNFIDATKEWQHAANLTFLPRTNESSYIIVSTSTSTNIAEVGRKGGRSQFLKIMDWDLPPIIIHEIGHALGLVHENQRSDRDTYIQILPENVRSGHYQDNFNIIRDSRNHGAYDFDSIMHYARNAQSRSEDLDTIRVKAPNEYQTYNIGTAEHLSPLDQAGIRYEYGPSPDQVPPTALVTSPGSGTSILSLPPTAISGTVTDQGGSGPYKVEIVLQRQRDLYYWNGSSWEYTNVTFGDLAGKFRLQTQLSGNDWTCNDQTLAQVYNSFHLPSGNDLSEGRYKIYIRAYDNRLNTTAQPQESEFIIDRTSPSVSITSPSPNAPISALTSITGNAQDNIAVSRVQLLIKRNSDGLYWTGSFWGPLTPVVVQLTTPNLTSSNWSYGDATTSSPLNGSQMFQGSYTLTATSFDAAGNASPAGQSTINVTDTDSPTTSDWHVQDIATDSNNKSRVLWVTADGRVELWRVGATGVKEANGPVYGPYPGWTPRALSVGGDGKARILFNNTDTRTMLRAYDENGLQPNSTYGMYSARSGVTATDIASDGSGKTFILWSNGSGQMQMDSIDTGFVLTLGVTSYTVSGWTPKSIAVGPTTLPRVLWRNNTDSRFALWTMNGDGTRKDYNGTSLSGYMPSDIAVDVDGKTRLMWSSSDGRLRVDTVDSTVSSYPSTPGTAYSAIVGVTPQAISVGTDAKARVVWNNGDGRAVLWIMTPANARESYFSYPVHP